MDIARQIVHLLVGDYTAFSPLFVHWSNKQDYTILY